MSGRTVLIMVLCVVTLACARRAELPPPEEPVASTEAPEPMPPDESASAPAEDDALDDLGGDDAPVAAPRPEAIEVTIEAVITGKKDDAELLTVGVNPRFTLHMKIETVEPQTPLLEPGHYDVLIHSPSKTFRGPMPGKGTHIRFNLSIFPEDPEDPHDETFFTSLWVE